ncbi:O-antigen ligase family protein [Caldilinea sp.]|uniref:O-antigen ligase family protein n=1 Tax=Caldilinea sp. TaxID=2293560 RepID=UPI002CE4CBAA|nr:O-antigen ligase family protein [Caldilinea sp.]
MISRLLRLEPLWILCLTPLILLPGRWLPDGWQPFVVLALFIGWPLRWLLTRRLLPPAPLHSALAVLLLWLPVNLWAAVDAAVAWRVAGYLLLGVALYGAAIAWPPLQRRPGALAWLLVAFATALALVGPLLGTQESTWPLIVPLQQLAAPLTTRLGETINPNILAGALVVLFPLITALAVAPLSNKPRRGQALPRAGLLLLALLIVAVILLADSRGALLAAGIGLLVVLVLRWPRLLWMLPVLLVAVLAAVLWIGPAALLEQIGSAGAVGGLDERLEIWSRAFYALQDFSFTGVGLGAFDRVIPLLYPYFLIPPSIEIPHAHNLLLQVGIDLGIPGLVAYLAILMVVFVRLISALRRPANGLNWALAAGVLSGLTAMLVHGLLDAPLWGTKLAFLPWLFFALAMLTAIESPTSV